jgi:hypothetical protein
MAITDLLLEFAPHGKRLQNCLIQTGNGVRVTDVVWMSKTFFAQNGHVTPYTRAPEICIEIITGSEPREAVLSDVATYLGLGAIEVWTCTTQGELEFFTVQGSALIENFPLTIALE